MKLDDKIRSRRIAYLLKGEAAAAFELALLYFMLAKRRTAEVKITDACLKVVSWLKKANVNMADDLTQLKPADQLDLLEKVLVRNKAILSEQRAGVGARRPALQRDFGLAYIK